MPSNLKRVFASVTAVTAAASTATSSAINIGLADEYDFMVNITAATGTSPTMDIVVLASFDKGTTYANIPIRFAQMTAAGVHYTSVRRALGPAEAAFNQALVADTGGALAKNVVFDPEFVKFKYTIGGTNPSFTFKFIVLSNPRSGN